MLNIKKILKNRKNVEDRLRSKDPSISIEPLIIAYEHMCKTKADIDCILSEINKYSKEIGEKNKNKEDVSTLLKIVAELKIKKDDLNENFPTIKRQYETLMDNMPNIPDEDIKVSLDPSENVEVSSYGEKRKFDFPIKNHLELNEKLKLFDFERGVKLAGSNWPVYRDRGAKLEWALLNLMIDIHSKNGFTFHLLPHLVHRDIMYGSGQLPKFDNQLFKIKDNDYNLYLIPTAEVPLNGLHYDEIIPKKELPKLYTAYTPCFRREAGGAGKNERGLIRVHQFNKVEMFAFTTPEESDEIFKKMCASAEEVLQTLELHYRNMLLVTGDTSFGAARTIDIEVYLPGQGRYYEVSSISNCRDYQSRRSKIRYKNDEGESTFVHTLNGSGLATSRLMIALLENNQQEDGSVILPKGLLPYYKENSLTVNCK